MNVVAFPGALPTAQQVLQVVYKVNAQRPMWQLEMLHGEEGGAPYVVATHSISEAILGFHWKGSGWVVTNTNSEPVDEAPSLEELMHTHLR